MLKRYLLLLCLCIGMFTMQAHTIDYVLEQESNSFGFYIWEGVRRIIPLGLDHILFYPLYIFPKHFSTKKVILQASMFTLAHTITLGLVMFDIIDPPTKWVEALIAMSIVFLAAENLFVDKVKPGRIILIFLFGLVHGMGFASALTSLNLPKVDFVKALVGFNIGVEMAQLSIILLLTIIIRLFKAHPIVYRKRVVIPMSIIIILIASYWTVERIFF